MRYSESGYIFVIRLAYCSTEITYASSDMCDTHTHPHTVYSDRCYKCNKFFMSLMNANVIENIIPIKSLGPTLEWLTHAHINQRENRRPIIKYTD